VRGPHGGYELAREPRRITVGEIVRAAMSLSTAAPEDLDANSDDSFLADLDSISVEQMCERAERAHVLDDEKAVGDFAI
jgi:Rrf2 family transcriptional regulator, iron-sulfur cluster assembly transcription factor